MSITRREFLSVSAAAGAAFGSGALPGDAAGQSSRRPVNLLFVLADQWRFSAFGRGSDEVVRTPHIDRLTGQGAWWERCYAANPVCTPNRSCILTGRFSHQTGMIKNDLMLPPSEVCWPQLFRDAGYATHYIGKWHMDGVDKPGFVPPGWRRRGFETFEGFNRGHVYHSPYGFDNDGQPLVKGTPPADYYEPALQTDLAIEFIRRNKDRPFCCYLSWGPPHTPFNPPRKFKRYAPADIRFRPNVPQDHRQQAARDLAGYYGLCESLDFEMGRLTEFLESQGLTENTLLVFTADHGELAGSHGKYRKGEPEEESLHVPLYMRLPGRISAGSTPKTLISSVDLMPTMLALCGLEVPGSCVGRNLSTLFSDSGGAPSVDSVYAEGKLTAAVDAAAPGRGRNRPSARGGTWRSLVTERHKLTVRGDFEHIEGIYDLQNDPFEMENLAREQKGMRLARELGAELKDWARRTGDSFPSVPASAKEMYSPNEGERARG